MREKLLRNQEKDKDRNSRQDMFCKKRILQNFAKFTEK